MPPILMGPIKGSVELTLNLFIPHVWKANSIII